MRNEQVSVNTIVAWVLWVAATVLVGVEATSLVLTDEFIGVGLIGLLLSAAAAIERREPQASSSDSPHASSTGGSVPPVRALSN